MAVDPNTPPATPKQLEYLKALLQKAGYSTFREARHTFGLTQRQASGKFTKRDASALIERLVNGEPEAGVTNDSDFLRGQVTLVRGLHAQVLADELLRRGWTVEPPLEEPPALKAAPTQQVSQQVSQSAGTPKRPRSKSEKA
jgi:hypothetical protein